MEFHTLRIKFPDKSQKDKFQKILEQQPVNSDCFEISMRADRDAEFGTDVLSIVVTFFAAGGLIAIAEVAKLFRTTFDEMSSKSIISISIIIGKDQNHLVITSEMSSDEIAEKLNVKLNTG